jgi:hypothetical protein
MSEPQLLLRSLLSPEIYFAFYRNLKNRLERLIQNGTIQIPDGVVLGLNENLQFTINGRPVGRVSPFTSIVASLTHSATDAL